MAVKPEVIKARLKALFPKANLSQKRIDTYVAKLSPKPADDADDATIDAIINDYNDVIDFVAVAQEDDRMRTFEAEKKKAEEAAGKVGKNDEKQDVKVEDDAPAYVKALLAKFDQVTADLESIKSGNAKQSKLEQAKSLLEKSDVFKKLDETTKGFMLKNVELDSETSFEEQITSLEGMFSKMVQTNADNNQYAPPAFNGGVRNAVDEKLVSDIVDSM
jgi:hypothetical protein